MLISYSLAHIPALSPAWSSILLADKKAGPLTPCRTNNTLSYPFEKLLCLKNTCRGCTAEDNLPLLVKHRAAISNPEFKIIYTYNVSKDISNLKKLFICKPNYHFHTKAIIFPQSHQAVLAVSALGGEKGRRAGT